MFIVYSSTHFLIFCSNYDRQQNSNYDDYSNHSSGRTRRDSEAEWEEWHRMREEDEYSGLMTPREKGWLKNIQAMQLNSDNPYQDDYYYVVSDESCYPLLLFIYCNQYYDVNHDIVVIYAAALLHFL